MRRLKIIFSSLISAVLLAGLTACSNLMSSELPNDNPGWTVTKAYNAALNGEPNNSLRQKSYQQLNFNRTSIKHNNPTRLPNPDITLYVYPHYIGSGMTTRIPAYHTAFPLYQHIEYE